MDSCDKPPCGAGLPQRQRRGPRLRRHLAHNTPNGDGPTTAVPCGACWPAYQRETTAPNARRKLPGNVNNVRLRTPVSA